MRDFYKVYENDQTLLRLAMKIGWTLNVVIMKAELTRDVRKWYLEQARHRGWTKAELQAALHTEAYSAHREETETAKPIKTQFARKLHMFKPCLFVTSASAFWGIFRMRTARKAESMAIKVSGSTLPAC